MEQAEPRTSSLNVNDWAYFKDQRFQYSGSDLIYIGYHTDHKAPESDENWYIWKCTYDGSNNLLRQQGPLIGAWENRTTLDW